MRQRLREAHDQQRKRRKNDQRIGTKSRTAANHIFKDFKSALHVDRQCFFWSWSANMHSFHPSGSIL